MPIVAGIIMRRIKDKLLGDTGHLDLKVGDKVVAETEHGLETGVIYEKEKLVENIQTFLNTVIRLKPSTAKGQYIKSIFVSSTMGPGIQVDRGELTPH